VIETILPSVHREREGGERERVLNKITNK